MKTIASLLFVASAALPLTAAVEIGKPAPDFTLTDIGGQVHKLSDFKGRIVVLEWNNPDCPIVRKHYDSGNMPSLQKSATASGVVWLTINSSAPSLQGGDYSPEQINAWLKQRGAAPSFYLKDPDGKVGHLFAAKCTPHMFVIDASGTLVYDGAIDSIPSARESDIKLATNYVSQALSAVETGKPVAVATSKPYGCSIKYRD